MLGKMLLIDTNVLVSVLLKQNRYEESRELLNKVNELNLRMFISDFAVYSISLLLNKRGEDRVFNRFVQYLEASSNLSIYRLQPSELKEVYKLKQKLDLDDKIHYYIAKKKKAKLITYDKDFKKTGLKSLTPAQALKELESF